MKILVIFLFLVLLPSVNAIEVSVGELFEIEEKFDSNKEVYFYVGDQLIFADEDYVYNSRLGSDFVGKTLPFGERIVSDSRFSFTGKELDDNLYHFGARYYDSEVGRFVSVDPFAGEGKNLPYAYVSNNPLMYIDPSGMIIYFPDSSETTQNFVHDLNVLLGDEAFYLSSTQLRYNEVDLSENKNAEKIYDMIKKAIDSYTILNVHYTDDGYASYDEDYGMIKFDPNYEKGVPYGAEASETYLTPQTSFAHELMHAFDKGESDAVKAGNLVRSLYDDERNNPRVYYGGLLYSKKNPTKIWLYTPETYDKLVGRPISNFITREILRGHAFDEEYGDIFPYDREES